MKRFWVVMMGFGLAGCAGESGHPEPGVEMASASGVPLETLQRGRQVYLTDCTRCHEAQMPAQVSTADWHVVVPGMAWNAGISEADEAAVLAYILAVKRSGA